MLDKDFLYNTILQHLPSKRKFTPGQWLSFNCPHCQAMGESRPDRRMRGGIKDLGNGAFVINCFNCGFKTSYTPGNTLSKKLRRYMESLGISKAEIKRIAFKVWQIKQNISPEEIEQTDRYVYMNFPESRLPKGAEKFSYWLKQPSPPQEFLNVVKYVYGRGEEFLEEDLYWTPIATKTYFDLPQRVIIPLKWRSNIVGWQARTCNKEERNRYIGEKPNNYLFNADLIYSDRKYLLIVEGILDALVLNCLSPLGSSLNEDQIRWLNMSGKEIVVMPDNDKAGDKLIEVAKDNDWAVAFPWQIWNADGDKYHMDATDAVKKFGRLWTLKTILETSTKNKLKIDTTRKMIKIVKL